MSSASRKKCKSNATWEERIARMYACSATDACHVAPLMASCVNCRLGVEAAQSRVYARKMNALRADASCSSARCVEFVTSVAHPILRTHLASMAWWRFSLFPDDPSLPRLIAIMRDTPITDIPFGDDYMHVAVTTLSACTPAQLMAWFGHENPYQMTAFYSGRCGTQCPEHCQDCPLLHRGCTQADTPASASCTLWRDETVRRAFAASPTIGDGAVGCGRTEQEGAE